MSLQAKAAIKPVFQAAWRAGKRAIRVAEELQDPVTQALLIAEGEVTEGQLTALLTNFAALQPLLAAIMADADVMAVLENYATIEQEEPQSAA